MKINLSTKNNIKIRKCEIVANLWSISNLDIIYKSDNIELSVIER